MPRSPLYQSRALQIADHLRERLKAHHWVDWLPSERELSEQLGVARRTIHAALQELQREGWISKESRQGARIQPRPLSPPPQERTVGMLFHTYHPNVKVSRISILRYMKETLAASHIRLDHHRAVYLPGERLSSSFLDLMAKTHHDLWVISSPTPGIEQWFAKKKQPAMVYGIPDPAIGLPSFSTDFMATARHTAGEMLRLGHREIALILPNRLNAQDKQCMQGLEATIAESTHTDANFRLYQHDESRASIHRLVHRLLKLKPRPTAWLIGYQEFYISIHCYLQALGINIPQEITLVNRDTESYMQYIYPEPTRYMIDYGILAKRCARYIVRLLEGHPPEHLRMMPEFIAGETMAPPGELSKNNRLITG